MRHVLLLVGPNQRLFAEDLCVEAGVIKADSAVLVHVFREAGLQGCYRMRKPVVQLVHLQLFYQAEGSTKKINYKKKITTKYWRCISLYSIYCTRLME